MPGGNSLISRREGIHWTPRWLLFGHANFMLDLSTIVDTVFPSLG
jgi:hypothetical protein